MHIMNKLMDHKEMELQDYELKWLSMMGMVQLEWSMLKKEDGADPSN